MKLSFFSYENQKKRKKKRIYYIFRVYEKEVLNMARHNFVFLYGKVTKNPKIITDDEGNFLRGQCSLTTARGVRSSEDDTFGDYKYDCPVILTKNPDLIFEMSKWRENDMVEVKGTISTRDIKRTTTCPHCGHQNTKIGVLLYITPIYCSAIETGCSNERGMELIREKCEISNQCIVAGNLCNDPQFYRHENGLCQTQYQIALNRKFRVKEDPPETKTDFPWVKSQGENAESDAKFLMKGSSVLVEGFIQTREIIQRTTCEECGEMYDWNDRAMEIVPYSTEYLLNCRTIEEIEEMEKSAQDEVFSKLFGT